MTPAGTNLGRFPSKFLLMVIPGLVASGLAASVLYAVHVSRAPSSSEFLTDVTPQGDGLSAEERRGLTREMLKARRENPQEPAEVRPMQTSRPGDSAPPADPVDAKAPNAKVGDAKAAVKAAPDRTPPDHISQDRAVAAAPLPVARPAPRARADAPVVATPAAPQVAVAAPSAPLPVGSPSVGTPPGTTDPALQPAATANASSSPELEPQPRGFAASVFSSLSKAAGTAANATGNTVNWVIDLPGKAISAGGRLFGGDSSPGTQQPAGSVPSGSAPSTTTLPPPATAPPPRRNL